MGDDLSAACNQSIDPPDAAPLIVAQPFLAFALDVRGPTRVGKLLQVSSRTVRRRALELRLVKPGPPVFSTVPNATGTSEQVHTTLTNPVSTLTDDELDRAIANILSIFPNFGRRMIVGHLCAHGHYVPEQRVAATYVRVRGAPAIFGRRIIIRKKYQVAGPNSLVYHDGQHGLIHGKFVTHCFIDGYAHFVTGIRVHTNNRADSVLSLFLESIAEHGIPSHVCGNHGTENIRVAEWMETNRGLNRGSYIWGRSVHNTRIEHLWYDVTQGSGAKWKSFLLKLERSHGLDADRPAHIWLVHHLFLNALNADVQEWASTWNAHRLHITGEQAVSPRELFMFGMVRHGPQGIKHIVNPADDVVEENDVASYGIDWDINDDPILMAHHQSHNDPVQEVEQGFGGNSGPAELSEPDEHIVEPTTLPSSQLSNSLSLAKLPRQARFKLLALWQAIQALPTSSQHLDYVQPLIPDHPGRANTPNLSVEALKDAYVDYNGGHRVQDINVLGPQAAGLQNPADLDTTADSLPASAALAMHPANQVDTERSTPELDTDLRSATELDTGLYMISEAVRGYLDETYSAEAAILAQLYSTPPPYGSAYSEVVQIHLISKIFDHLQITTGSRGNRKSTQVHLAGDSSEALTISTLDVIRWARINTLKSYSNAHKRVTRIHALQHWLKHANPDTLDTDETRVLDMLTLQEAVESGRVQSRNSHRSTLTSRMLQDIAALVRGTCRWYRELQETLDRTNDEFAESMVAILEDSETESEEDEVHQMVEEDHQDLRTRNRPKREMQDDQRRNARLDRDRRQHRNVVPVDEGRHNVAFQPPQEVDYLESASQVASPQNNQQRLPAYRRPSMYGPSVQAAQWNTQVHGGGPSVINGPSAIRASTPNKLVFMGPIVGPRDGIGVQRLLDMIQELVGDAPTSDPPAYLKMAKLPPPKTYEGKDNPDQFEVWLRGLLEYFNTLRITGPQYDTDRLRMLSSSLSGNAATWFYNTVQSPSRDKRDWMFKEAIVGLFRHFVHRDMHLQAEQQFAALRFEVSKGGVAGLYERMLYLADKMWECPTEFQMWKKFIKALPEQCESILSLYKGMSPQYTTLYMLYQSALELEQNMRALQLRKRAQDAGGSTTPHYGKKNTLGQQRMFAQHIIDKTSDKEDSPQLEGTGEDAGGDNESPVLEDAPADVVDDDQEYPPSDYGGSQYKSEREDELSPIDDDNENDLFFGGMRIAPFKELLGELVHAHSMAIQPDRNLRHAWLYDAKVRKIQDPAAQPKRDELSQRTFSAEISVNGVMALALFDSGCTTDSIMLELAYVCKADRIDLKEPVGLQLGTKGSRTRITYGARVTLQVRKLKQSQYFDAVNIDKIRFLSMESEWLSFGRNLKWTDVEELQKLRDKWYAKTEDIMRPPPETLPPFREVNHCIPLIDEQKKYRYHPPRCADVVKPELLAKINRYVAAGWWRPVTCEQAALLLCVAKKDGKLRTVVDARQRNSNTVHDLTPFPDQDLIRMDVARAKYRSKIDISDAYEQVRIVVEDVWKTAFATPFGTFVSEVMQQGDTNAPSTFQRLMTAIFRDCIGRFVHVYLDDISVFSDSKEEHEKHLEIVFDKLRKARLYLSRKKCDLFSKDLDCLGHRIDDRGLHADTDKMSRIRNWWTPRSYQEVQRFLGLVNYLAHFMPDVTAYTTPLSSMVHNNRPFVWRKLHDKCFEEIKALACKVPILKPFDHAKNEPIWLICDASVYGLGILYGQGPNWQTCCPAGFLSKKFTSVQRAYRTYEHEALAILEGLLKWEDKLLGRHVHIVTDHKTLQFLEGLARPNGQQIRWYEFLARFQYDITYVPGKLNKVADCLSCYYENDTVNDHAEEWEYVNADVRLDPDGDTLPFSRAIELKAGRVLQKSSWLMAKQAAAEQPKTSLPQVVEPRVLEAEQLAQHQPPSMPKEPAKEDANPKLGDALSAGPSLRLHIEGKDGFMTTVRQGYAHDSVLRKVQEQPKQHKVFAIHDGFIYTKNR
ncbi:hypothetical protein ACG7TL_009311 [Trametes sanguinea]